MASERVAPPSISSQTSIRAFFRAPGGRLLFEDLQAPQDGQAGVLQDRELAGEGGQGLRADAADGEGLALLPRLLLPAAVLRLFFTEIFVTK